jgi:hypothetical protein
VRQGSESGLHQGTWLLTLASQLVSGLCASCFRQFGQSADVVVHRFAHAYQTQHATHAILFCVAAFMLHGQILRHVRSLSAGCHLL